MDKKRILIGFEMMRSGDMRGSRLVRTINRQKDGRVHIKTLDMPDWRSNSENGCYNTETGGSRLRYSERICFDLNRDFLPEAYEALDEINCILDDCCKVGGE